MLILLLQVQPDGSGTFPVPSKPGLPLRRLPAVLLARLAAAALESPPAKPHADQRAPGDQSTGSTLQPATPAKRQEVGEAGAAAGSVTDSPGLTSSPGSSPEGVSRGSRASHTVVADFLVSDPAAEGVPPTAFGGVVNSKDTVKRQSGTDPTLHSQALPLPPPLSAVSVQLHTATKSTAAAVAAQAAEAPKQSAAAVRDDPWALYHFPNAELAARGGCMLISAYCRFLCKLYEHNCLGSGATALNSLMDCNA